MKSENIITFFIEAFSEGVENFDDYKKIFGYMCHFLFHNQDDSITFIAQIKANNQIEKIVKLMNSTDRDLLFIIWLFISLISVLDNSIYLNNQLIIKNLHQLIEISKTNSSESNVSFVR